MPRGPSRFTQSDIAKALKAIKQSGASMAVEIALDGTIRIVPVEMSRANAREAGEAELDRELEQHRREHGY